MKTPKRTTATTIFLKIRRRPQLSSFRIWIYSINPNPSTSISLRRIIQTISFRSIFYLLLQFKKIEKMKIISIFEKKMKKNITQNNRSKKKKSFSFYRMMRMMVQLRFMIRRDQKLEIFKRRKSLLQLFPLFLHHHFPNELNQNQHRSLLFYPRNRILFHHQFFPLFLLFLRHPHP